MWLPLFPLMTGLSSAGQAEVVIEEKALQPKGQRYQATVPDTLDLAERARLSVQGLTRFLNEKAHYAPYGHTYFNANPPYMSDLPMGPPNWGKIAEGLLLARLMCGSEENLDIQAKMLCGMLSPPVQRGDGQNAFSSDYWTLNPAAPTPLSRVMLALMALYQQSPNSHLEALIEEMARAHAQAAQDQDGWAYYCDPPPSNEETFLGVLGYWLPVFVHGCAIRTLTRWSNLRGDGKYLDLSGKLVRFLLQEKFWTAEAEPKAIISAERGHFRGHFHSYTQALMGLLCYALATDNAYYKEFVRSGYEYLRNFGIARIGLFGEGCTVGDMTYLALKLSDAGVGDYWDDADQYIRNHLTELQITDAEKLRQAVEKMPPGRGQNDPNSGPLDPFNETTDQVIERNVGIFLSDATHPTLIPAHSFLYTICCTGNCTPALYFAWESIVREQNGTAQVNLLLNRASPGLDLDSYLPYEGKVVIHIKKARRLTVRIPKWVDRQAVSSWINGKKSTPFWAGRYLVFSGLRAGTKVKITFPMAETTEQFTLKWKQSEFWKEGTDPGPSWTPAPEPSTYTCRFRGNTLVDITPRDSGPGYPLYQRERFQGTKAPLHRVIRYIPPKLVDW